MHVLVTRAGKDAAELKARLEAFSCQVSSAPLISIEMHAIAADVVRDATGIIATSRNGLRALAASPLALAVARHLPVFAVGPATAALAHDLGFATVMTGQGTGASMVPMIAEHARLAGGDVVHLAGDHLAFDLAAALAPHHVRIRTVTVYRSVAAETLPDNVAGLLRAQKLDAVILMSPRTAATWTRLTRDPVFHDGLLSMTHVCMSAAVAEQLPNINGISIARAEKPDLDTIVSLVYRLAGPSKTE